MSLTGVAWGRTWRADSTCRWPWATTATSARWGRSGSARPARPERLGICVGTGIGAGFVQKGKLWRGARESAGEIGHIVMQIGGPKCGCGNRGCLEALASRTAIERDIRAGRGDRPSEHPGAN